MKSIIKSCTIIDVKRTHTRNLCGQVPGMALYSSEKIHALTLALLLPDYMSLKNSHNLCLFPHLQYYDELYNL